VLLRLAPDAIERLASRLADGCVLLSATNGKTTTAAMANTILAADTPICRNAGGANLVSGIASALLTCPRDARLGLFEVDEAVLPEIAARVRPRAILLGNLFRDQLDRYGELELLAARWRTMVAALPAETRLVVNADDPLVAALATDRPGTIRFGLDDPSLALATLAHAADSIRCPRCSTALVYDAVYLGHLGDYRCPSCGLEREALDVAGRALAPDALDGTTFDVVTGAATATVALGLPGLYNVYNALGAVALASAVGCPVATAAPRLGGFRAAFGRFERVALGDREALLLLIKNPTGANEAIRTLEPALTGAAVMVALNDRIADGRDVSWIWDVDFEQGLTRAAHVVCAGTRAADLAVRMRYAGVPTDRIHVVADAERALDATAELAGAGGTAYVLPTYTAMLELQRVITARGLSRPYWEAPAR
jgi:UDP-N-acetylmuramyl tripeptide synthase